eukprot:59388-Rhodomonas_salina.1
MDPTGSGPRTSRTPSPERKLMSRIPRIRSRERWPPSRSRGRWGPLHQGQRRENSPRLKTQRQEQRLLSVMISMRSWNGPSEI